MNKKVMAAAVAGALALPAAAMAQVTISGAFRMGLSQHSISAVPTPLPAARSGGASGVKANLSEWRFGDNVTQIIFQASEDLGGGLKATGRFEW
ncbi:MAG: porin, partial [Betaproteobacteria bacterium]|nr:porin [Betaproteobacteria bacterium]